MKTQLKAAQLFFLMLILLLNLNVSAQKLPNVQKAGIYMAGKLNIDSVTKDWRDPLQAYNKSIEVFYTLANDNENLYLRLEAKNPDIIAKIVWGGITFSIKSADSHTKGGDVAITFPKYDRIEQFHLSVKNKPELIADRVKYKMQIDSFVRKLNTGIGQNFKLIEVEGVRDVAPVISAYNDVQIKAAAAINGQLQYVYEMALPLKYFNQNLRDKTKFTYNIRINGGAANHTTMALNIRGTDIIVYDASGKAIGGIPVNSNNAAKTMGLSFPTDFTGEYTLVGN